MSRLDTYVVKKDILEKTLGHRVSGIYPMLSEKPTDWSDVPIIMKPWGAWVLNRGMEYMCLTAATDKIFHFLRDGKLRHGIYSQYPE